MVQLVLHDENDKQKRTVVSELVCFMMHCRVLEKMEQLKYFSPLPNLRF